MRHPDDVVTLDAYLASELEADALNGTLNGYLSGPHWRRMKSCVGTLVGNRCEACGRESEDGERLQLHHKHYKTVGRERLEDVELLCPECHPKADMHRQFLNWLKPPRRPWRMARKAP